MHNRTIKHGISRHSKHFSLWKYSCNWLQMNDNPPNLGAIYHTWIFLWKRPHSSWGYHSTMVNILGCFAQPTTQKTLWCQNTLYYYPYQTTQSPLTVHNTRNGIHFSTSRSLNLSHFLSVLQHKPARESHYWDFRDSQL